MDQTPAQTKPAPSPARRALRDFAFAVVALHVVAIAVYYALRIAARPERVQRMYGWGWMGLTVVVVLAGLQRLKRARRPRRS